MKHVPDAQGERRMEEGRVVRGEDDTLNELDEYAIEAAVQLVEAQGGEVIALSMGPEDADESVLRALQMGADRGVHICDPRLAGTDAPGTALVLSGAITMLAQEQPVDMVLMGMASLDGMTSLVPAGTATYLEWPFLGLASELEVAEAHATIVRQADGWTEKMRCALPAVISVTDQINEPRYPSFKALKAARSKPLDTYEWNDVEPWAQKSPYASELPVSHQPSEVIDAHQTQRGNDQEIIEDTGEAGIRLAQYLMEQMD